MAKLHWNTQKKLCLPDRLKDVGKVLMSVLEGYVANPIATIKHRWQPALSKAGSHSRPNVPFGSGGLLLQQVYSALELFAFSERPMLIPHCSDKLIMLHFF